MQSSGHKTAKRIAILVDAENISAGDWPVIARLFDGIGTRHSLICFGDFTDPAHAGWLDVCRKAGGSAETVRGTASRYGAAISLAVEALSLVHEQSAGMIVIVSDEPFFAPLARAISASGRIAVGVGFDRPNDMLYEAFDRYYVLPTAHPPVGLTPQQRETLSNLLARLSAAEPAGAVPLARLGYTLKQQDEALSDLLSDGRLRKALTWYGIAGETGTGTAIRIFPRHGEQRRNVA